MWFTQSCVAVILTLILVITGKSEAETQWKDCELGLNHCGTGEECYIPEGSKKRQGLCVAATCGGTLTNQTGDITFPTVKANTTCTWYITAKDKADQTSMLLTYNLQMNGDSLSIFEGNETIPNHHNLTTVVGGSDTQMVISLAKVTTIVFTKGSNVIASNSFTIHYDTKECKQTIQGSSKGFRSPVYHPGSGPVSCDYSVSNTDKVEFFIIAFNKFSLPHGSLTVDNTTKLTGTTIPDDVLQVNMTKLLHLVLKLDKSNQTQKFQVEFPKVNQECAGTIDLADGKEQVSVSIPTALTFPAECRYYIHASGKSKLVVMATILQLTEAADIIVFHDGGSRYAKKISVFDSSTEAGKMVIASGGSLLVRTLLQAVSANRNVSLQVQQQVNGGRYTSKGRIELKKGSQKSATYPSYYLLAVDSKSQVELVMNKSSMLPNSSLDVYDGGDETQRRLVSFRSQGVPFFPITSSGNKLLVVANNFNSNQSFAGDFSSVPPGCNTISTENMGGFDLMRKNVAGTSCSWTINPQLSQGYILLKIKSSNLCNKETITVYQGLSEVGSLRIATVTQQNFGAELPLFSSSAKFGIKVVLNHAGAKCDKKMENTTALSADYTIMPKDCGGTLNSQGGELVTPQYPNVYPLNSKCTWKAPNLKHSLFYLSLSDFQLGKGHVLNVSQVKGSTQNPLVSYSGNIIPQDFLTNIVNKTLMVKFDASNKALGKDIETPGKGFKLTYRYLDCGGYMTKTNGAFGIPKAVTTAKDCIWIIRIPKDGPKKSVNIVSFNFTSKDMKTSAGNGLEIRDGGSVRANLLNLTQGSVSGVLSRTNMLWVRYTFKPKKSSTDATGFTFNLKYTVHNCNSSQLCDNGICIHPDWICNGHDDCGDDTDERNCIAPQANIVNGVKTYIVVIIALLCFAVGVVLTIVVPAIYKRIKYPNYSQLRDMMEPSTT